ncbi:MAG: HEAT repeat domain-containing protein [Acidobacteriota bacterium]|nr:HEAT repeat domain-containing protein [Acidobacteriota bacterium]
MSAFATASDNTVEIVWWIGLAINACVVLMMLQVLAFRGLVVFRERKRLRVKQLWEPILLDSVFSVPAEIPSLEKADAYEFLVLWNYLHESLRDEAVENLNVAARGAGADVAARHLLKKGNMRKRLMAATALGNIRDDESRDALEKFISHADATLSLTAAQALMQIDAKDAIKIVMPLVSERMDWSLEAVAAMFKKAGADVVSLPLSKAIVASCCKDAALNKSVTKLHAHSPRLIYLLRLAQPRFVSYVIRYVLLRAKDVETVNAALKVCDDPTILPTVRKLLADSRWQVRVNAAQALGRTGTARDEKLLVKALRDKEWWVRYRAAQALANLPSVDSEKLELYAAQTSKFSGDILRQVIAERRLV